MLIDRTFKRWGLPALIGAAALAPEAAFAVGPALPWEGPLAQIQGSLSGPVVQSMAIIAVVIAGLTFAFSEGGGLMRRSSGIVVGLSSATVAATLVAQLFGVTAGLAF